MKTALLVLSGAAALTLSACNKPAPEPAADTVLEATPAPADSVAKASAPQTEAEKAAASRAGAAGAGSMTAANGATPRASTPMSPPASATPTAQETIDATKPTLSPAGASSGPTAPPPKH